MSFLPYNKKLFLEHFFSLLFSMIFLYSQLPLSFTWRWHRLRCHRFARSLSLRHRRLQLSTFFIRTVSADFLLTSTLTAHLLSLPSSSGTGKNNSRTHSLWNSFRISLIVGDFNFHCDVPANTYTSRFIDLLDSFNLCQSVTTPIHRSGHILDWVWPEGRWHPPVCHHLSYSPVWSLLCPDSAQHLQASTPCSVYRGKEHRCHRPQLLPIRSSGRTRLLHHTFCCAAASPTAEPPGSARPCHSAQGFQPPHFALVLCRRSSASRSQAREEASGETVVKVRSAQADFPFLLQTGQQDSRNTFFQHQDPCMHFIQAVVQHHKHSPSQVKYLISAVFCSIRTSSAEVPWLLCEQNLYNPWQSQFPDLPSLT